MIEGSRRGSVHTLQGFCVSMLPHIRQIWILSMAVASAAASGAMICSRFLMRNSAARRADRGPKPGRRASSWIRRSISGPATAVGMGLKQLHPRRQRQAPGDGAHLVLHQHLDFAARVGVGGEDEVLDDLLLGRLDKRLVDLDALHL